MAVRYRHRGVWELPVSRRFLGHLESGAPSGAADYYYSEPYYETCHDFLNQRVRGEYLTGSGLTIRKHEYRYSPSPSRQMVQSVILNQSYRGQFIPSYWGGTSPTAGLRPTMFQLVDAEHQLMGPKGWSRFKPERSGATLGQFLIELRDIPTIPLKAHQVIPKLLKIRSLHQLSRWTKDAANYVFNMRNVGKEYLNIQFGWVPFLNDLARVIKISHTLDSRMRQIRRNNGRNVRRRGVLASTTDTMEDVKTTGTFLHPVLPTVYYASLTGSRHRVKTVTTKHWFSGSFMYHIPDTGDLRYTAKARRALYGVNPSPSLLWEVLPWSWLIDWFASTGDVLNNISSGAVEGLVSRYAFVMSTTEHRRTVTEYMDFKPPWGRILAYGTETYTEKLRSGANPFGFGLAFADLNSRQMMILAALGLSRH